LKVIAFISVLLCGGLLIYGTIEFPKWGDPTSPASTHLSPYYIEEAVRDTSVPNIVTAVLADYRGYDTMFETTVIFSAGLACLLLLRRFKRKAPSSRLYRHVPTGITLRLEETAKLPERSRIFERIDSLWVPYDLITKTTSRLVVPFIQLFALYVVAHGHHSPGGGFQGGVIFGAAVILFAISYTLRLTQREFSERKSSLFSVAGVLIYAGTGALCVLLGSNFLDYSALSNILGVDKVMARSHGILIVEIGVGIAVMAVMVGLYYNLSSAGKQDEGL
jgi:multicomponent Na+:H+ antiporter subunit B